MTFSHESRAAHCDVRAPLCYADGREFRFVELRCRHEWDWENVFIVEMELCEISTSDCFCVWVTIHWEARTHDERIPSERAVFGLARHLAWEYFAGHRQMPCCSRHAFPIRLEF